MNDDKIDLILEKLTHIESQLDRMALRLEALEASNASVQEPPVVDEAIAADVFSAIREAKERQDNILSTSANVINLADLNTMMR